SLAVVLVVLLDQDRCAVLVGPAHHQHVAPRHPLVPAEHVTRQGEAGDVADVTGAVGIRPGRRGEDVTGRGHGPSLAALAELPSQLSGGAATGARTRPGGAWPAILAAGTRPATGVRRR